ncbi:DUF6671 family protein [Leucobacter sp. Z1108]|uniref:DUF6671 family protein n=1 Tax=Leucobacter sp. Z1108 TaxID=3439066 RepID=UPI003F40E269
MTPTPHPYRGAVIAFATMHGKEQLARGPFHTILGATVLGVAGIDTDQFGTFAGDIPRTLPPRETARAKARLGIRTAGLTAGLASEGSFTTEYGWSTRHNELVLFLDEDRGIEVVESRTASFPLPPGRHILTSAQALSYATSLGFPHQGVIVQAHHDHGSHAHKDTHSPAELEITVNRLLDQNVPVSVLPDYRAHRSPARADILRDLCSRMARRLSTPCPGCRSPGYGRVKTIPGLPCGTCGQPTHLPAADIHACSTCDTTHTRPRTSTLADPQWCETCNP